MADTLYGEIRSQQNLFSAWRHVKRSALNSPNPKIRGEAAEFEHEHQRHLRRIQDQLREKRFRFDDVEGTLKDKKKREAAGKNPRPIAIASLRNRVVQRAILQVLQPREARDQKDIHTRYLPKADPRLGRINKVNTSQYGVGGLMKPFGGVAPAIRRVMEAMENGGAVFYQSDIKEFFMRIPTDPVVQAVLAETKDREFSDLFSKALEVNLANVAELGTYRSIFPSNGKGVAQGSSLSAFAGNLLLYDFDHELNAMGVTAIRYIDDLFIVAKDDAALDTAIAFARQRLGDLGFELYDETKDPEKAARGSCSASFDLLGCAVQPGRCVPSQRSVKNVKKHVDDVIKRSTSAINSCSSSGQPLPPEFSFSGTVDGLRKHLYGWQKSFAFCTDVKEFRDLDRYVADRIADYQSWFIRKAAKNNRLTRSQLLGLPSMASMFHQAKGPAA